MTAAALKGIKFPGSSIIWDTFYDMSLPRNDKPECKNLPLKRNFCSCKLVYSIPKSRIDAFEYNYENVLRFVVNDEEEKLWLYPQDLLDYGHLHQYIVSNPKDFEKFNFEPIIENWLIHKGLEHTNNR